MCCVLGGVSAAFRLSVCDILGRCCVGCVISALCVMMGSPCVGCVVCMCMLCVGVFSFVLCARGDACVLYD